MNAVNAHPSLNALPESSSGALLCLKVESCRDCPRLEINKVKTFLGSGYEYICTKAGRHIYPHEGVNPPPEWCPLRHNGELSGGGDRLKGSNARE